MTIPGSSNPLLLAGSAAAPAGYNIERSVRFNSADSAYLSRTPASAGNRKTWTWAGWVKRSLIDSSSGRGIFTCGLTSTSDSTFFQVRFGTSLYPNSLAIGSYNVNMRITRQVFRDTSAWYHICIAVDTTQATGANRIKLYVNGAQVTSFVASSDPSLNADLGINNTTLHNISSGFHDYFSGYLADIHFCDGYAYDPSYFTEFDDNGILQPIAFTGSYGTNGFHLPFSDNSTAAALGTDTSGNGNDWTVNNLFTRSATTLPAVAFDGSGDYLSISSHSDHDLGSGDFTVEGWFKTSATIAYQTIIQKYYGPGSYNGWNILLDSAGTSLFAAVFNGSNIQVDLFGGSNLNDGNWHHFALARSGTDLRLFVDGTLTDSTTNSFNITATSDLQIGRSFGGTRYWNGYLSNLHIVKGTALYTSNFTIPSAPLTAVTNTKLLCCQSSSSATAATVSPGTITANGDVFATTTSDSSSSEDSLVDSPTNYGTDTGVGGEVRGNYCTLNPLDNSYTLSNGNLQAVGSGDKAVRSTIGMSSGKWYCEFTVDAVGASSAFGIAKAGATLSNYLGSDANGWSYIHSGLKYNNASGSSYGSSYTTGDIIGVSFDADAGELKFYKNGTVQNSGTAAYTGLTSGPYFFAAGANGNSFTVNFGQRPFAYPVSGFKALCTANLPTPTIADGSTAMDVVTYTGNGSTQTISGLGFSPDFLWFKSRSSGTSWHGLFDSVRGNTKVLSSNSTTAEATYSNEVTTFNSDGFSLGASTAGYTNYGSQPYVAWTWDAGSSTVTNTDGSITSQVRANPSAGFSIVTYTGTGVTGTVGHGLGASPSLVIIKKRSSSTNSNWVVWSKMVYDAYGANSYQVLDLTNGYFTFSGVFGSNVSSTTFPAGTNSAVNGSSDTYVAYCFAPVESYSAFGSYVGNGSATDGPFVYTGHRPRWVMIKASSASGSHWMLFDTERSGFNVADDQLYANLANAEATANSAVDFLSNGFKPRADTFSNINGSSITYIYACFAEHPLSLARAR